MYERDGKHYFAWGGMHECSGHTGRYVDYGTLARAVGDAVMANTIMRKTSRAGVGDWEQISGFDPDLFKDYADHDDCSESCLDVCQWFIVTEPGAELLKQAGEIVFYNDELDLYLWGVDYYGTSWDYVPTKIEIPSDLVD